MRTSFQGELQRQANRHSAFSLLEMSIVIVIISLLISAILGGRGLIDDAKLQAIVAEVSEHKLEINSFYAKYGQYPGDFSAATGTTGEWGAGVAYGDNNGHISFKNTAATPVYEGYRAWQHLSYAGMTKSQYTGTITTGTATPGTDVPLSKSGGGYLLDYSSVNTAYNHTTAGAYGFTEKNVMVLGVPAATTASPILANGTLTPNQAMGIDQKMDDGSPLLGAVRGADGATATQYNCVTSAGIYNISLKSKDCIIITKAN